MSIIQQPLYILTVLLLLVLLSEWLAQKKFFKHIGSVLLVIIFAAVLANINVIPSSHNAPALYDGIFQYAAPLGLFFLLLQVKLKDLKLAGLPMIMMFLIGSATTIAGVVIGYYILSPQQHHINLAYAVAGMYTGTYIGGSANLNAVALEYGVNKEGTLFAAINAADNIITDDDDIDIARYLSALFSQEKKNSPPVCKSFRRRNKKTAIATSKQYPAS
jgi:uncharacterized membrane protein